MNTSCFLRRSIVRRDKDNTHLVLDCYTFQRHNPSTESCQYLHARHTFPPDKCCIQKIQMTKLFPTRKLYNPTFLLHVYMFLQYIHNNIRRNCLLYCNILPCIYKLFVHQQYLKF